MQPGDLLARKAQFSAADLTALIGALALLGLFIFLPGNPGHLTARQHFLAIGVTVVFASLAWLAGGVNWSGALAGSAVAFLLAARSRGMFLVLLLVFAVTLLATRLGKQRKQSLRMAESSSGRSASQVMANLGIAALLAAAAPDGWPLLALAALAEAATDTSSSEIGMAFPGKTVLLTSWKPVPPGMDGGVSILGTAAALLSAGLVALCAVALNLVNLRHAPIIVYGGVLGMLVDSALGALFERRGYLNNDLVNLLGTASAVAAAWALR